MCEDISILSETKILYDTYSGVTGLIYTSIFSYR